MMISKPEKVMKGALKEAGHTIAEYAEPAPREKERDAEDTLAELMTELDNDKVGQAIAQSDETEAQERKTDMPANDPRPPLGKTGS